MKLTSLLLTLMISYTVYSQEDISKQLIAMERSALERWNSGDPSGFLEISANDVVYFDPFLEQRLDGLEKLRVLYESIRGKVQADKYKMINPKVQSVEKMAVLTFNLISYSEEKQHKWNCTEVYRLDKKGWRIIQTHWSLTKYDTKINN